MRKVYSKSAKRWIEVEDLEPNNVVKLTTRKRRSISKDAWVKIPIREGIPAAIKVREPAWAMLLIIREQIFLRKENQVRISNEVCRTYSVSRHMRKRGLAKLVKIGAISVEQVGCQSPLVSWRWPL